MSKYAYVTVMYGNNIYLTGALVLGYSLKRSGTQYDRVVMVTEDVSDEFISFLKPMYTHIIIMDYMIVSNDIFSELDTRFRDVFTKLNCLGLIQYDKIILLDLDMIVAKNIDHLFKLNAPAACLKRFYVPYGKIIPKNNICKDNKLVGSINAGLMLLKPDRVELESIRDDVSKNKQINKYKYPEQDYLSLRYCGEWTSITFNYNFQFGLTHRVKKCHYGLSDIYVIHYSSSYKPWNTVMSGDDEAEFKKIHNKYYILWSNAYDIIKKKYEKKKLYLPY